MIITEELSAQALKVFDEVLGEVEKTL